MDTEQHTPQKRELKVQLTDVTVNNLEQVKLLVRNVIPVQYSDTFYQDTVSNWPRENPCTKLAYHNEYLVGTIIARREAFTPSSPLERIRFLPPGEAIPTPKERARKPVKDSEGNPIHYRIYIAVLAVLKAYQNGGIGTKLVKDILQYADQHYDTFDDVSLHVHVGNLGAIRFYESLGFQIVHTIENYFRDDIVSPPHCHFMTRKTVPPMTIKEFTEETPE